MLSASGKETLSHVDELLARIFEGDRTPLELPRYLYNPSPGVEVAVTQCLITWAAFATNKAIKLSVPKTEQFDSTLRAMLEQPHALAALSSKAQVTSPPGDDVSKETARIISEEFSKEKPPLKVAPPGRHTSLVVRSATLAPQSYAPFVRLAVAGERPELKLSFLRRAEQCLAEFHKVTKTAPLHSKTSDLPTILYELFANSEEWGSTTLANRPVQMPIRGITFRVHSLEDCIGSSTKNPIQDFINQSAKQPDCRHLLEVAVFDAGVGLAQRHLKREIKPSEPLGDELNAVYACLKKHGSSSENSARGLGLHHVMNLTSVMKGFLRVRTGRLHLFRNFSSERYLFEGFRDSRPPSFLAAFLNDWYSGTRASVLQKPDGTQSAPSSMQPATPVKGAVFNFLFPLKDAQMNLI